MTRSGGRRRPGAELEAGAATGAQASTAPDRAADAGETTPQAREDARATVRDAPDDRREHLANGLRSAAATVVGAATSLADAAASTVADAASTVADAASNVADAASTVADAASGLAGTAASAITDAAAAPVSGVASAARAGLREVGELTVGARRRLGERAGARVRRVRRRAAKPLPNVYELHPEVRRASLRELGLQTVSVATIRGTAVEGPVQRGGDFLPVKSRRGADWRGRWQRIQHAVETLADLPPIELLKFGDDFWVVDGHNRVAAALYAGQEAIDAVVIELRLPGMASSGSPVRIAEYMEGTRDLRDAGHGRFTRTAVRPSEREMAGHEHPAASPPAGAANAGSRKDATDSVARRGSAAAAPDATDDPATG